MSHTHSTAVIDENPNNEGLETLPQKRLRLRKEMVAAGVNAHGLSKFDSHYLPTIIHDLEHIKGVIYGRFREGPGFLNWVDRMVVATDRRVISLNHKPGYTDIDEFTYDIIDGVDLSRAGPFYAVTLNTKIGHFTVRFVRRQCAEIFVHYIEKRRLEYFEVRSRLMSPR